MDRKPPDLDPARVASFGRRLAEHPRSRMALHDVWAWFAAEFPGRPQGADERSWLLAALQILEKNGTIRTPASKKHWDRTAIPYLPKWVARPKTGASEPDRDWQAFPWHPRLSWVPDLRRISPEVRGFLGRVHEGLVNGHFAQPAPLRYRSLQLTGNEKRLAEYASTTLFGEGRLDLELLGCLADIPPIATHRIAEGASVLVVENAGTFAVARRVLSGLHNPPYSVVAFGDGARFEATAQQLRDVVPGLAIVDYVGDLDRDGLRIALSAARRAELAGAFRVRPAPGVHAAMLRSAAAFGSPTGWPHAGATRTRRKSDQELVSFLPVELHEAVSSVLAMGRRIPEEVLGPMEFAAIWAGAASTSGAGIEPQSCQATSLDGDFGLRCRSG